LEFKDEAHLKRLEDEVSVKSATDPRKLLEQESERLHLSPQFRSLLEPSVPKAANRFSTEPLPA